MFILPHKLFTYRYQTIIKINASIVLIENYYCAHLSKMAVKFLISSKERKGQQKLQER